MKFIAVPGVLALWLTSAALAAGHTKTVSNAGTSLRVPAGWHAAIARSSCDPERLIVVASGRSRMRPSGRLLPPRDGQVLIVLLEVHLRQDRPDGNLRRPAHFAVTWNRLLRLEPCCGILEAPAFMRYFKTRGRNLGFIVYPTGRIRPEIRSQTLAIMDSLRVTRR